MNILYLAPCGLNDGIGGGARLKNMIDILGKLDTNVLLLSYRPSKKFGVEHKWVNKNLYTFTFSVNSSFPKVFKAFVLGSILIYGLRYARKADIIFAHAPGIVSGFLGLILSKVFGKPLIIDHMDTKDPDTPKFIYEMVIRNSTVFAISRYLEDEANKLGCREAVYLPVFVDTDVFRMDVSGRAKVRAELGINNNEVVIGYAGSFSYVEGLVYLIKAFKNLSARYEDIKLVIIGGKNVAGSTNVESLTQGLDGKVVIVPQQSYGMMPKYMSIFDIACCPKIDCEGNRAANPIKIYEYMSMGLPVVVSALGGITEVIENRVNGFLIKSEDTGVLEKSLGYLIQYPNLAQEVGYKAREKVVMSYSQQTVLRTVGDVLRRVNDR